MSARSTRAVLFDLDDTLYGYARCNAAGLAAAQAVLAEAAPIESAAFRALHDDVRRELARRLAGQAASHNRAIFFKLIVERHAGPGRGALAVEMFDRYWSAFLAEAEPAPGALAAFEDLGRDHALALVTNHTTDIQLRKLERLGLARFFQVVLTSEELGFEKPDGRAFEAALAALGTTADRAVMVGDNPGGDVGGAARVGLRTVLSTEFTAAADDSPGAADRVVSSIRDVPAAVRELLGPAD